MGATLFCRGPRGPRDKVRGGKPCYKPRDTQALSGAGLLLDQSWAGNCGVGVSGVGCGLVPLSQPPDSTPGRAGTNVWNKALDQGRCLGLMTVTSLGRLATRMEASPPPRDSCLWDLLGFPEIWSGSGHPRERSNSLLQASGSTRDGPGSGPPPKTPGLSRADQSRGEAGGPVFGSPPPLPSPLQESETLGCWGHWATVPGLLAPIPPSLGPLASGLCDHRSTLKSAEANLGETATSSARVGPGPLLPPAAGPCPQGLAESSVGSFTELPASSQLEGQGNQTVQGPGVWAGQGSQEQEVSSLLHQAGGVCCVCTAGREEYVGWRL